MPDTKESRNKALVLKAFDALFNRRDYAEAGRYWSGGYIQHSAHIKPGRDGLFDLVKRSLSGLSALFVRFRAPSWRGIIAAV